MLKNYFKTAWRSLWKNKVTGLINIAGLSVGMTAAVLIMVWVQNELNFDNYHKDENRIYRLTTRLPTTGWTWETTPLLLAEAIKKEVPEIEKTSRLYITNPPVFNINNKQFYEKDCAYVDDQWFSLFDYEFIEGSPTLFNQNIFSVILSSSEARKLFNNSPAVDETIRIDSINYQVTGVVKDAPVNSSFQYKAFIPIAAILTNKRVRENDENWSNANYLTFVKVVPGGRLDNIVKKITDVMKKHEDSSIGMISLNEMHFEDEIQNSVFIHGNRSTVYVFCFLGFILLLVACINYVNLTTAKASLRAREISVRKISGARRSDLFFQFVIESILISLIALLTTLVLVKLSLPAFNQITGRTFAMPILSIGLWKVLAITVFTATLLNSIYPGIMLSSFKPIKVFSGRSLLKMKDTSFRKSLVILQFTVSIVLIAGTIIIYRQMQLIQTINPGYNRSQVLSFRLPSSVSGERQELLLLKIKQELFSQSGIESVSTSSQSVVNNGSMCTDCADWEGRDASYKPVISQLSADADFQKTLQLQMKEGRWFRQGETNSKHDFIVNETAVKYLKLPAPVIGQPFTFRGVSGQIVGVVKDFSFKSLHEKTGSLVIFNNSGWRNQFVVRTGSNTSVGLQSIERAWKKLVPESPLEYIFLDDAFNNLYKRDQQTSSLILVLAVITIVISALGLFSLAALAAEQRTKEIGIRKVLGASIAGITALLSKDFLKLVCVAILIASPIGWWAMEKWLQNFAYKVEIRWWVFALAGVIALLIALIITCFHTIKAALTNPVNNLRSE